MLTKDLDELNLSKGDFCCSCNDFKEAASPIIHSKPKSPAVILSSIESASLLNDICINVCSIQAIDCFLIS